jgi:hypothetical protein
MEYRREAQKELGRFCKSDQMPTVRDAVKSAARSEEADGKRHPHQRRIREGSIVNATKALLLAADRIHGSSSFGELLKLVEEILANVRGVGELYTYDVSLRIGAWLGHMPEKVYLHRGTRIGARALGLDTSEGSVEMSALPVELQQLPPSEVEDILCIYKDRFIPPK